MFKRIGTFFKESWEELKKVTWPTKEEGVHSALIVIAFLVVFALFLSVVDMLISAFMIWVVK